MPLRPCCLFLACRLYHHPAAIKVSHNEHYQNPNAYIPLQFQFYFQKEALLLISSPGDAAFITSGIAVAPTGSDLTGINDNDHPARHPIS